MANCVELCEENNWPQLTAITVRKDSRKPGVGFLEYLFPEIPEDKREDSWKKILEEVYTFNWDKIL